jgi:hypothetical protein
MSLLNDEQRKAAEAAVEGGLLPEGEYAGHITEVASWKEGASLVWKFDVEGQSLWDWTPLGTAGIWRTKERFAALGVPLDADGSAFEGMPVKLSVELGTNTQSGEPKNKVTAVERGVGDFVSEAKAVLGATDEDDSSIPF